MNFSGIVGIPFLKKSRFTGSHKDMCFAIEKYSEEEKTYAAAIIWPGPNCFDMTPAEMKRTELFEFTEEGLEEATVWLNREMV